ncbi:MAG: hypothetical protein QM762_12410 [Chryseolinea sp.]
MHKHLYTTALKEDNPALYKTQFQTPPDVAKYMCEMIPAGVRTVLEPTPGVGNILRELKARDYDVTAPSDFFLLKKQRYDCIVMNPPFSSKFCFIDNAPEEVRHSGMKMGYWFLRELLHWSDNVIALMPWFTISDSDVRLRLLMEYGMKSVTALPRKTFSFARIQTCVFELQRGYRGDTAFKMLPYKDTETLKLDL